MSSKVHPRPDVVSPGSDSRRTRQQQREETRTRLLDAAERLFAEKGFKRVRLQDINTAAGQKNKAAVPYYFGGMSQLLRAVLTRHFERIDQRANELLDEAASKGRKQTIRGLLTILVTAFVEDLETRRGIDFAQLLAYTLIDENELLSEQFEASVSATKRLRALIQPLHKHLQEPIALLRGDLVDAMLTGALVKRARQLREGSADIVSAELFATNLIDAAVAIETAPISSKTSQALNG